MSEDKKIFAIVDLATEIVREGHRWDTWEER